MPPTLLVIDLQQGLVEGDPEWGPRSTPQLADNVLLLLKHWRGHSWPVIHVHHNDADPSHPLRSDHPETFRPHSCSVPLPGEPVFLKGTGSAFIDNPVKLENEIRAHDNKVLCIIGMDGSQCITSNARHAADLGFDVTVVADACSTYGMDDYRDESKKIDAEETHHAAMGLLANDDPRVVMTDKLLEMIG